MATTKKALDVRADEIITAALITAPVAYYALRRAGTILLRSIKTRPLAVASDPLDGSSNIDNQCYQSAQFFLSIPLPQTQRKVSSAPGQIKFAAVFFVYGPQTSLVITAGSGTELYVLNPDTGVFELAIAKMSIAQKSTEFAINASNLQHWGLVNPLLYRRLPFGRSRAARRKIQYALGGGSLVADANRILMRGGIFMYPSDDRQGYAEGRLRLLYEANPVAFVIEQGGRHCYRWRHPYFGYGSRKLAPTPCPLYLAPKLPC